MEPRPRVEPKTVRIEESSIRQVWRLMRLLIEIKGRILKVVPPGNEAISDDIVENKGRFSSSAGISNDFIENTPLVPLKPTILVKTKQIRKSSGAGSCGSSGKVGPCSSGLSLPPPGCRREL
jgi:hypothetical protein